jgi:hypothetical protein
MFTTYLIEFRRVWLETGDLKAQRELAKALHSRKLELRFVARIFLFAGQEDFESSFHGARTPDLAVTDDVLWDERYFSSEHQFATDIN